MPPWTDREINEEILCHAAHWKLMKTYGKENENSLDMSWECKVTQFSEKYCAVFWFSLAVKQDLEKLWNKTENEHI